MKRATTILILTSVPLVLAFSQARAGANGQKDSGQKAKTILILVDGACSPGVKDTKLDKILDTHISNANDAFEKQNKNTEHESHTVRTKGAFLKALKEIKCDCKEPRTNIVIYMTGHGTTNPRFLTEGPEPVPKIGEFVFSKEKVSVTSAELNTLIMNQPNLSCCNIHFVIDTCHSGAFMKDLLKHEQVKSVYTSCGPNEISFISKDGWEGNFIKDWDDLAIGKSIGDQMEQASWSAQSKLPQKYRYYQHPDGWRKGKMNVRAHVDQVGKHDTRYPQIRQQIWATFHDPNFMRYEKVPQWIPEDPKIIDKDLILKECDWIEFVADFNSYDAGPLVAGRIKKISPPSETITGVVEKVDVNKIVTVHAIEPARMYCKNWLIEPSDPKAVHVDPSRDPHDVIWIRQPVSIIDPNGHKLKTDKPINRLDPKDPSIPNVDYGRHIVDPCWVDVDPCFVDEEKELWVVWQYRYHPFLKRSP